MENQSKKLKDLLTTKEDLQRELTVRGIDLPYLNPKNKRERKLNAEVMIECITEVLNDGTKLDWNNENQTKYYPFFKKTEDGWVLEVVYASYDCSAELGSGCYFKDLEDVRHAVKYFMDIYIDYLPE